MYKVSILALLSILFIGCADKPIVVKHKIGSIPKSTQSSQSSSVTPTLLDKKVMPYSKRVYSFDKYSRFMYQEDCGDLLYRERQLYKRNMKYDPISVLDITNELTKDIQRNGCR